MGVLLVVVGVVCLALGFLLAFTVYGMAALVVGVGCTAGGIMMMAGRRPRPGDDDTRGRAR